MFDAIFTILFWGGAVALAVLLAMAHNKPFGPTLFIDPEKELVLQQGFWPFFLRRAIGCLVFGLIIFNGYVEGRPLLWWQALILFLLGCAMGSAWTAARHARPFLKMGKRGLEISGKNSASPAVLLAWQEVEEIRTKKRAFTDAQKVTLVPVDQTKKGIPLLPSDYGCPPEFLFAALKAHHAAARGI